MIPAIKKTDLKTLLKDLWHHQSRRRQNQFRLLLGLMLISAFAEVVSLGAVIPFLAILATPDVVFNNPIVASLAHFWNLTSSDQLVLPLVIAFAAIALIAGIIRVLLLWINTRLTYSSGTDLSREIYYRTLHQPYLAHLTRNSSELLSGITNKVHDVMFGVLYPLLTLISSAVLLVTISFALFAINPVVASIISIIFSAAYGLMTWFSRKWLIQNGKLISSELTQVVKVLQEGLGCIRDVLLDGTQKIYCDTLNHLVLSKRKSLVLPEGEYNLTLYGSLYKTIKIIDVEILKEKITLLELQLSLRENKNFNKIRIKYSRPKREECGL